MEDARCLPWFREEEMLASVKHSMFSKPMVSVPMQYDAWSYARHKVWMVGATRLSRFKVITKLSYSFLSLTPIV
jgi:hypothetical protein